jgi:dolichyl-phosphate-mannose-protein mannosyltransferase
MASQNLWKVHLINADETGGVWHTIRSLVHLIHLNSSQALRFSGKQLPDWGFNQHEIVTDRVIDQEDTVWNVEEHRYTKESEQKDRERDMIKAEFVPLSPTRLGFWAKMKELQYKMLFGNNDRVEGHVYENQSPMEWLFLKQGIAYWVDSHSNSQVHLIGNLSLWLSSLTGILLSSGIFAFFLLRRRRNFFDISEIEWNHFSSIFRICTVGYLCNFLPYFFVERSLFLYYYLPCLFYQHLFLSTLIEFLESWTVTYPKVTTSLLAGQIVLLLLFLHNFTTFLPLSYGSGSMTAADVESLRWKPSWLFIIHTK